MWRPGDRRAAAAGAGRRRERGRVSGRGPGRPRDLETEDRIIDSTMSLLAVLGYNGTSIEAVAAQAGVGKTTVYRRWSSKGRMVVAALARHASAEQVRLPARGGLRADLRCLADFAVGVQRAAAVRNTMAGLAADLAVDPDVAEAFRTACAEPNRVKMRELLRRAAAGGEAAADADPDVLTDLLFGAVLWRALFSGKPLDEAFTRSLVDRIAASVQPATPPPGGPPQDGPPAAPRSGWS